MDELIKSGIGIVAGFIGAIIGVFVSQWQARKQKAFDRQLDWYERQIGAMHDFAQAIEIACTFHMEGSDTELLKKVWRGVQSKHLALDSVMQMAPLYGSSAANRLVEKLESLVDKAAEQTEAFDLAESPKELVEVVEMLANQVREKTKPLAAEARKQLLLT